MVIQHKTGRLLHSVAKLQQVIPATSGTTATARAQGSGACNQLATVASKNDTTTTKLWVSHCYSGRTGPLL
jgi:hypothetical protein